MLGPITREKKPILMVIKQSQAYDGFTQNAVIMTYVLWTYEQVGIDWGWLGDVYIVMGDKLGQRRVYFPLAI